MYDEIVTLISTVGFPIAVCVYLLVRLERKIDEINGALSEITTAITNVIGNQKK